MRRHPEFVIVKEYADDGYSGVNFERPGFKQIAEAKLNFFGQEPLAGVISGYSKAKKQEAQRLPFSLSTLQVLAGRRFGYEPQQVLDTAQALYERKLTTYPRSDCEYLPTNQFKDSQSILTNLQSCGDDTLANWVWSSKNIH